DDRAGGQDTEGDVRRIQPVVRDGRHRDVRAGVPVHERGRSQGWLAGEPAMDEERAIAARHAVRARELHEQVVRVLSVDERRTAVRRLTGLKEQWIALLADRTWLEREHGAKPQGAGPKGALGHPHAHVVAEDLLAAAISALVVVDEVG